MADGGTFTIAARDGRPWALLLGHYSRVVDFKIRADEGSPLIEIFAA
jgi:hypothetical protein